MANDPSKAFEISSDGILMSDNSGEIFWQGAGSLDPSVVGINAPDGSSFKNPDGIEWIKNGPLDTDWIKNFANVFEGITPPFILNHNSTLSNNQLIGYTNLVNNPVVIGFRGKLVKVTYINGRSNSDADFRFYRNDEIPVNLFHTMSFTNTEYIVEIISTSPIFEVGDLCRIYFYDTGTNPSDMNLVIYFEAVP